MASLFCRFRIRYLARQYKILPIEAVCLKLGRPLQAFINEIAHISTNFRDAIPDSPPYQWAIL